MLMSFILSVGKKNRDFFTRDDTQNSGTINADIYKKAAEPFGWIAKTANIGTAIRQIPYTFYILMLLDEIQKPSDYLF